MKHFSLWASLNSRHETRVFSPTSRSLVSYIYCCEHPPERTAETTVSVYTHGQDMCRVMLLWKFYPRLTWREQRKPQKYWCSWVVLWLSYKYRVARVSATLLYSVHSCLHVAQAVLLAKWLQGRASPTTRWSNSHADSSCCQSGPAFKPVWWVLYCCPAASYLPLISLCNLCPSTHNNRVHTLFNLSYLFFTGMNRCFFTFWPLTAVLS